MEAELEIKKSKERGQVGKRSTGEVSEITNNRGGTIKAMFLSFLFCKLPYSLKTEHFFQDNVLDVQLSLQKKYFSYSIVMFIQASGWIFF